MKAPPNPAALAAALAESRAPRYTSYPTAVQFGPQVNGEIYADWLVALPNGKPVSLYVHVPFCQRLCWYCGCNMQVNRRAELVTDYIKKLDRESELVFWTRGRGLSVSTLHLGGGSPDTLSPSDLDRLFASLTYAFEIDRRTAIDAEIDPAHVSGEWIRSAARHGLGRASLGVQTFAPAVQAAIHRPQSFERVAEVVQTLRAARVEAINFDLMYGLPKQTETDVLDTLDLALTLRPNRIAMFGYAHMPHLKRHQGLIPTSLLPGSVERQAQAEAAAARLVAEGYVRIGLDHYALPDDDLAIAASAGRLHRNFQGYTTDDADTLIGLGVSAISHTPEGYAQNETDLAAWAAALAKGRLPVARGFALSKDDRLRADAIERLMCDGRIDLEALCRRHGEALATLDELAPDLQALASEGLVRIQGATVSVTDAGRPFIRTVCTAFDRYFDPTAGRHAKAV